VIVWLLDLQLSMQSVPFTSNVVSSNPAHDFLCIVELVLVLNIAEIPLAGCQSINQHNLR
jgi:hypothetical protein